MLKLHKESCEVRESSALDLHGKGQSKQKLF